MIKRSHGLLAITLLGIFSSLAMPEEARVTVPRANVRSEPTLKSAVVVTLDKDTIVDVLEKSGQWYRITIRDTGETGYVFQRLIKIIPPSSRTVNAPKAPLPSRRREPSRAPDVIETTNRVKSARTPSPFGAQVFVQGAYLSFFASHSFETILGSSSGATLGGGVRLRYRRLFAEASLTRFKKTGERAFVFDNEAYSLGIPDTVTITPMNFVAGLHVLRRDRINAYAGVGFGRYKYKESSDFEGADDGVNGNYTSYNLLLGAEARINRFLSMALEVQAVTVPDAIGEGGVSEIYGEKDLGYGAVQLRIFVGR